MINKNKEEIEKIKDLIKSFKEGNIDTYALRKELKATIKTSIQWCEWILNYFDENEEPKIYEQLQIHLTWLKEKLKEKEK